MINIKVLNKKDDKTKSLTRLIIDKNEYHLTEKELLKLATQLIQCRKDIFDDLLDYDLQQKYIEELEDWIAELEQGGDIDE